MNFRFIVVILSICTFILVNITKAQTVKDVDGNTYKTVQIGGQIWMADNLRTTKYNDGKAITLKESNEQWLESYPVDGYCWYENSPSRFKIGHGALYNFITVSSDKLCPIGWHVPSRIEWEQLFNFVSEDKGPFKHNSVFWKKVGKYLKSTESFTDGSDAYGFGIKPSGIRSAKDGKFSGNGGVAFFWTSTNDGWAYYVFFEDGKPDAGVMGVANSNFGYSVRCVKN